MTNCSTLYDEHLSCEMSVASQNQDVEQRNAQNGHCAVANYHNRGKRLIIVAKTTWWKGLHSCFAFGGRGVGFKSGPGNATLTEFGLHHFLQDNLTVPDTSAGPLP